MSEDISMEVSQHTYQHAASDGGKKSSIPGDRQGYSWDCTRLFYLAAYQPQRGQCFLLMEVNK